MVKFSFFTVRSKCCKKSKFVLFLYFLRSAGFEIFKFYIYCVYGFFFVLLSTLITVVTPSINVSVERSPMLCAFSHSLFFLFRFNKLQRKKVHRRRINAAFTSSLSFGLSFRSE